MNYILNILQNTYVSGVIIFALTWPLNNWFTKKVNKNEYFKKVKQANADIMSIVIEYITTFKSIDVNIVLEIINAIVFEKELDKSDLVTIDDIRSILIKEIVKMKLVESNNKNNLLENIMNNLRISKNEEVVESKLATKNEKSQKEVALLATMMSVITALLSMLTFWKYSEKSTFITNNLIDKILYLLASVVIIEIAVIMLISVKKKNRKKSNKDKNKDRD
ncbi:hypothetical protein [Clostridium perfringens]|uniref:hypothetical protein n=1 Tax=Clostridium perfringens TaxID=1502 RepID=UPI000D70D590|nr:hypothetical protein [Clostridium perfringens]PWX52041.1 hypothetical protein CYK61_01995 [Clostridium perfringens]